MKNEIITNCLVCQPTAETVVAIHSPIMLKRKKRGKHPLIRGAIALRRFNVIEFERMKELGAISNLDPNCNVLWMPGEIECRDRDTREEYRRLQNKIARTPTYFWRYFSNKGIEETIDFVRKSGTGIGSWNHDQQDFISTYTNLYSRNNWRRLSIEESISILQKNRIMTKIIDDFLAVRLAEPAGE